MIMGHYATALVAYQATSEKENKKANIWLYLAASQVLDFAMVGLVLLGIESFVAPEGGGSLTEVEPYFPYSHHAIPALVWAVLGGGLSYAILRDRYVALWVFVLMLGHEVLDMIAGFQHNVFGRGTPAIGLNLYHNAPVAALLIEAALCLGICLWFFHRRKKQQEPLSWTRRILLLLLLVGGALAMIPPEL